MFAGPWISWDCRPYEMTFRLLERASIFAESIQATGAIADTVHHDTHSFEHGHVKICHRSAFTIDHMPAAFDATVATTGKYHRQRFVGVTVTVCQSASINYQGVVQQRAVGLFG